MDLTEDPENYKILSKQYDEQNLTINLKKINTDDFFDLNLAYKNIGEFMSLLKFESTISRVQIKENYNSFQDYVENINLSEKSKDEYILSKLSMDSSIAVRYNVARNRYSSLETLKKLSNDPSDIVKVGVKYNKNTPKNIADEIDNPF
jgi:hypothetical protein